jgi:hypothetical protein
MANTVSSFGPTDPATIALRDKQWHEAKGAAQGHVWLRLARADPVSLQVPVLRVLLL